MCVCVFILNSLLFTLSQSSSDPPLPSPEVNGFRDDLSKQASDLVKRVLCCIHGLFVLKVCT